MNILIYIFWFVWEVKYILFWLYLWQLKEYHFGRFVDHFRTHQGKKLVYSVGQIAKLILLVLIASIPGLVLSLSALLFLIYFIELALFIRSFVAKSFKKPVFTAKAKVLTLLSFFVLLFFFYQITVLSDLIQIQSIILFDLLTPFVISSVVLLLQPLSVLSKQLTINKAAAKLERIKKNTGLRVIAITGSYGKTSTKEFLEVILANRYKVLKTSKHQNSEIGIANEIINGLTEDHQFFIAEVGAYNKGKVKEVCSFLKPTIGIVTGVNEQHLSLFGSMQNLLLAEGGVELERSLPNDGTLVVNGDNKYCRDLYKRSEKNKKLYSLHGEKMETDLFAQEITVTPHRVAFIAITRDGKAQNFGANVLGKHSVHNLLAAALVAHELGMTFEEIARAMENIVSDQSGMTLEEGQHGIKIIDSSYSANPDGVFADLDYLSVFDGKKAIIMPSLIELGKKSSEIHYTIGKKISEICNFVIVTTKDQFEAIKRGAIDGGMEEKNIIFCDNAHDIQVMVTILCKAGDAVLLEGRVPGNLLKLLLK